MPLLFLFVVVVGEGRQEDVDVEEHTDKGLEEDLEQRHICLFMRVSMIQTLEIHRCHSAQDVLQESTLVDHC